MGKIKQLLNSNEVVCTTLLDNEDKFKLDETTIFDRIINLKFTTGEFTNDEGGLVKDEFVLRSDYEIVYPKETLSAIMNTTYKSSDSYIRRCDIKPSIKVMYNQVSSGTVISIDIFVSNFFVTTKDGRNLMSFNQHTYDIKKIDIQMGYIGQFNALLGVDSTSINGNAVSSLTTDRLFDFDAKTASGYGIETITIDNVEWVKTEKLAPDYELHIHGYVGSTIELAPESKVTSTRFESLTNYFSVPEKASDTYPRLFYDYITKRYINRKNIPSGTIVKPGADGLYDDMTAMQYGVKVYCSEGLKALTPIQEKKDADGNVVKESSKTILAMGGKGNTSVSALQRISSYTQGLIIYTRLNNGDYIAYTRDEARADNIPSLFKGLKEYLNKNQTGEYFKNILPAVYNINIDGVATIVCPFFTWVNPFQELKFASRYVTSSITSFYAGFTPEIMSFYAINVMVTFATVEDVNEMQIKAVPELN